MFVNQNDKPTFRPVMLFYFEESSYFFPKQIDKDLKKHTFSCQMCFVSPESFISAKKFDSFAKSKVDFFHQKKHIFRQSNTWELGY
jgi:CRISPR/Cas system CSM-associated protein Csm4 (group 5 of RAMP superfamily)